MRAILLGFLVIVNALLAGCTEPGLETQALQPDDPTLAPVQKNETTGAAEFLRPQWQVGRWWQVQVQLDFGYNVLEEIEGTLVVSRQDASGFRVGSDTPDIGTFDRYFDYYYVGDFDPGLNASVGDARVVLYDWPLSPGKTWTTPMPLVEIGSSMARVHNASLTVSAFDDADPSERLRIQGTTDRGETIDYDYSAATGWMTYFRLTNTTTGRVVLSVDYVATGLDYQGPVHHVSRAILYERIVFSPPMDERANLYPGYAGVPPAERVTVKAGWDWVEELTFLFSFPIIASAGTASFAIARPDLRTDNDTHVGAGDTFSYKVRRTVVRGGTAGDWTVALNAAGTAGAYAALFGFKDETVEL